MGEEGGKSSPENAQIVAATVASLAVMLLTCAWVARGSVLAAMASVRASFASACASFAGTSVFKRAVKKTFTDIDGDSSGTIDETELYIGVLLIFDRLNAALPHHGAARVL